jgi:hypothetical protein
MILGSAAAPRRLWWLGAGFTVWCSALVFLYALHAIGCAFAWPDAMLRITLWAVLALHLVAIAWIWRRHAAARADHAPLVGFVREVAVGATLAALASALITFAPPLLLSACL